MREVIEALKNIRKKYNELDPELVSFFKEVSRPTVTLMLAMLIVLIFGMIKDQL